MRIITGRAKGIRLNPPKNYDIRPMADRVKGSVFNIIGTLMEGAEVVDLFAGTGNVGLECWSRGAAAVTFIDMSKEALRLVRSNIAKCHAEADCTVIKGNTIQVVESLSKAGKRYDFAFCDPPYNKGLVQAVVAVLAKNPFIKPGGYMVVEHSAHDPLPDFPEGYELVRNKIYGETIIDFVYYNNKQEK